MERVLKLEDLTRLIDATYRRAYDQCLIDRGRLKPFISLNQCHDLYGESNVTRWIDEGLIELFQDRPGGKYRINRQQIMKVASTDNRYEWFKKDKPQKTRKKCVKKTTTGKPTF